MFWRDLVIHIYKVNSSVRSSYPELGSDVDYAVNLERYFDG